MIDTILNIAFGLEIKMLQDEYDAIDTKIHDLKDQRSDFEEKLKYASSEDDEIEYKFQIMKINEKLAPLEEKHKILGV